jgi:cyclic pyranopterin phosphate synthase
MMSRSNKVAGGTASISYPLAPLGSCPLHSRKHTYLRLSLTERCNLRCTYCMPADGAPLTPGERLLSADELQRLVRVVGAGAVPLLELAPLCSGGLDRCQGLLL